MAGYFFFNRIEKLENEAQKKEYAISYLLKTLKIYFVWSVVLLPSRLILSKSSMLGVLLKWFRTVFFIGDAQLWYLNALLVGLILILILKKSKINDTWIMLIGVVFFIAGIFVQKTVGCGICQWICRILEIVLYDLGKDNKKWCVYGDVLLYAWDANPENPPNKNSIHLHNLSFYTLCCGSVLSVRMEKTVTTCCVGAYS